MSKFFLGPLSKIIISKHNLKVCACGWGWGEQMLSTIKPKLSEWHTVAYIYIIGIMKHMEHPRRTFHNKYTNK